MFQNNPPDKKHIHEMDRLTVNDCFLRNMQKYKYIANIDTDEIIIPTKLNNWLEMMEVVEKLSVKKVDY